MTRLKHAPTCHGDTHPHAHTGGARPGLSPTPAPANMGVFAPLGRAVPAACCPVHCLGQIQAAMGQLRPDQPKGGGTVGLCWWLPKALGSEGRAQWGRGCTDYAALSQRPKAPGSGSGAHTMEWPHDGYKCLYVT